MADKESGIDEILRRWRVEIKAKQRRIISFEETAEIKINFLRKLIHPLTAPLEGWQFREFIYTRHREKNFKDQDWRPIAVGQHWGGPDCSALFRCRATLPPAFKGRKVALKIYVGGDGLLFLGGKPYHGLDPFRDTVPLTPKAKGGETFDFEIESYIFWHFGESEVKTMECSHFAVVDEEMHDTYWDFRAAFNVLMVPEQDPALVEYLKAGLAKAIQPLDQNEPDGAKARARALQAREILRREIYDCPLFKRAGLLHACGNSHLDVVFLWTHAEFLRKLGRTHATTLRLMEDYPQYIFSQSQPLMYEEMKRLYPTMFEEVKKRIKEGRWEAIGASWVEPDCNLISGESFTRQFLYGTRWLKREFGVKPRTCWCPDVFGNAWTMPQIMKKSGLDYFVTHKMVVWNDTNPWRKNSFWWEGPDGSRVLSLVPPTHFIGTCEPDHMAKHWANFSDQGTLRESLYNYGWGDGGGGPDVEMLEYLKRYQDFPGVVPAKPITIEGALDSINAKPETAGLPVINDELYLEEHRGTFTTKARLKKLNRRCEFLFRDAELWSCFSGKPYPQADLEAGWKEVLTNQFHDSLPGSHIHPVYLDLLEAYDRALACGHKVLKESLEDITSRVDTRGPGRAVVVFNSLAQTRDTVVFVDAPEVESRVVDSKGNEVASQSTTEWETGKRLLAFEARGLPSVGFGVFHIVPGKGQALEGPQAGNLSLENAFLKAVFNGQGEITSLLEKASGRECLEGRRGNVLKLYEDVPGKYEAWDIAPSYTKVEFDLGPAQVKVLEQGPLFACLEITRAFGKSRLRQRVRLGKNSRRLDFETWVDWKEQQKLLKARFFTAVRTQQAAYDIAYGNIQRSTCRNNSFQEAKFEVPAHQWMDLSQPDFGVSLLNDCKYGHEALEGMMALTLLRGPINPDPESDQEEHAFTYSLFPHALTWREAGTVKESLDLNVPAACVLQPSHEGPLGLSGSFLKIEAGTSTLEAVKKAEDSGHLVVRLVERHGAISRAKLAFDEPISGVCECNLLEEEDKPVKVGEKELEVEMKPYEIRTFKLKKGKGIAS
jgi:alpha-mannosidase